MAFRITGLDPAPFRELFGLPEEALAARGVRRYTARKKPEMPDRIEVRDLEPGERALLLNYTHQPADTPYRASHAIYVREGAQAPYDRIDEVPAAMRLRLLSLRAFDPEHMMVDAGVIEGAQVEHLIERLLADSRVAYVQAHYAKFGCYAARIERA
ncbi:MAG TPA: DUF1203 domain-containing protein [Steroidobacteraceae bacterium]|nr:DUF1203 domain-containing protein [Steroidobacteraceae bacterium]